MGQIQNALNQIFASSIGMGIAINHSPYVKGQQAIKEATAYSDNEYETLAVLRDDASAELEKYMDEATTMRELNYQAGKIDRYKTELDTAEKNFEKAYAETEQTTLRYGTKRQKEEMLATRGEYQITEPADRIAGVETTNERIVRELREAYEAKRGVLESAQARLKQRPKGW